MRAPRGQGGQALVEFAVTAGALVLLLSSAFTLIPRSLLPTWMDEELAFSLRHARGKDRIDLPAQGRQDGLLLPPASSGEARRAFRQERLFGLRLLFPGELFPGLLRQETLTVAIAPLLRGPKGVLLPGEEESARRLALAASETIGESRVKPLVESVFLGGVAERTGLLRPLRKLGMDPVRVNLDALPRGET